MRSPLYSILGSFAFITLSACSHHAVPAPPSFSPTMLRDLPAGISVPKPVWIVVPEFSYEMRRIGIEGAVRVRCTVTKTGEVSAAEVLSDGADRSFAIAALEAVSAWKFSPGTKDGVAVPMKIIVPVSFTLAPAEEASQPGSVAKLPSRK
jgi:periplasmic protein TonB